MGILSTPAFGPRTAIIYITVGALMDVWTAVWYFVYVRGRSEAVSPREWFWLIGLFLTGVTLIAIGALLGHIGRSARRAEMPPPEATPAEAAIQQTAAAVPNPVVANAAPAAPVAPAYPAPAPVPVNPPAGLILPRGA